MRYFGLRHTFLNILTDSFFNINERKTTFEMKFFLLLLHLRTYLTIFRFSSCVGGGRKGRKVPHQWAAF